MGPGLPVGARPPEPASSAEARPRQQAGGRHRPGWPWAPRGPRCCCCCCCCSWMPPAPRPVSEATQPPGCGAGGGGPGARSQGRSGGWGSLVLGHREGSPRMEGQGHRTSCRGLLWTQGGVGEVRDGGFFKAFFPARG